MAVFNEFISEQRETWRNFLVELIDVPDLHEQFTLPATSSIQLREILTSYNQLILMHQVNYHYRIQDLSQT